MQTENKNKMRQFSSLLNEHWKRKQRLKEDSGQALVLNCSRRFKIKKVVRESRQRIVKRSIMIDRSGPLSAEEASDHSTGSYLCERQKNECQVTKSGSPLALLEGNGKGRRESDLILTSSLRLRLITFFIRATVVVSVLLAPIVCQSSSSLHTDPRPTIYSGQVSFGLLLSAHSTLGSELSSSASHQVNSILKFAEINQDANITSRLNSDELDFDSNKPLKSNDADDLRPSRNVTTAPMTTPNQSRQAPLNSLETQTASDSLTVEMRLAADPSDDEDLFTTQSQRKPVPIQQHRAGHLSRRQIFERPTHRKHNGRQSSGTLQATTRTMHNSGSGTSGSSSYVSSGSCSQVNANALYAGMGAIWASHQANLVGDSHLAIGTYVYDSCNDLDVGQRQSVRIVSNLNAFQQTTCESPRGSPISLTIAHGDNQLRAIQLLTSFRVPVITTKEHFALEEYGQLTSEQQHFLFTTAPSSRYLALGALKFSKRIVSRSTNSPNLPNQFYKMSSRNGLIVISRNLPAKFISFLTEMIPSQVNYEMLQSSQPIDQIRSVEVLESILIKSSSSSTTATSESRISSIKVSPFSLKSNQAEQIPSTKSAMQNKRNRRQSDSDSSDSSSSSGDGNSEFDSASAEDSKMLSPTILMFITPSEAIDLVTRLRNDLADASKYYSLIVATREDISPALKTIFHRGGSRLCSGKAFYTISPKPDDIGEFSRYFRDTVHMEGETSDHPLVCEFAKYQSTSKINADLDDMSTEPVIKAVWSAAAAFKSVHRRECGSLAPTSGGISTSTSASPATNVYRAPGGGEEGRVGRQSAGNKSAHAECMTRMNKNMSNLVQKALKRLDVTINSTGLQSLDGFRIKFDDKNELMTNKFTIKYINKECEISEIGQFSGAKSSSLRLDEETLVKSLDSTLPDAWPVPVPKAPVTQPVLAISSTSAPKSTSLASSNDAAGSTGAEGSTKDSASSNESSESTSPTDSSDSSTVRRDKRKQKNNEESEDSPKASIEEDGEPSGDGSETGRDVGGAAASDEAPRRTSKRSKAASSEPSDAATTTKKAITSTPKKRKATASPVTAMGGRGVMPGLTDTTEVDSGEERNSRPPPTPVAGVSSEQQTTKPTKPMRKLKPFPTTVGTTIKDWLPYSEHQSNEQVTVKLTTTEPSLTTTKGSSSSVAPSTVINKSSQMIVDSGEQVDPSNLAAGDLRVRATTQPPVFSTLPESDGNADLELTPKVSSGQQRPAKATSSPSSSSTTTKSGKTLETAATTESSDYVTAPSIGKGLYSQHASIGRQGVSFDQRRQALNYGQHPQIIQHNQTSDQIAIHEIADASHLKDLNLSPTPLSSTSQRFSQKPEQLHSFSETSTTEQTVHSDSKDSRSKIRSHLKWIYGSWFALSILGANICGALLTLYVLTFLLMKNCDGSLDRDNQGMRSMHLLAIIVMFFGSTLFIVYPTPGLCLLRTSWHNFSLVLLFGSLLLQTMQTRSLRSLGLGGRPNRLNQFLTLLFMVGVQVSFELQRWKYESANYMNFVNRYFGSSENGDKRLVVLSSSFANQFNPLNSFNDQMTPVSIQVSEQYQKLLQDYCLQQSDDFFQSQIYICLIVGLLVLFSITTRNSDRLGSPSKHSQHQQKQLQVSSSTTSGKLVASQHEANLTDLTSPSHFQFASHHSVDVGSALGGSGGNVLIVALISAPIYFLSLVLHMSSLSSSNRDLIFSVTMVLVAFAALVGIFLPILLQIHRFDRMLNKRLGGGQISRPVIMQSKQQLQDTAGGGNFASSTLPPHAAFAMFPEFTPTGLRRPSSASGESSSGAGSRRPFAETKESRRNMGAMLANLGPSTDSLRVMGFFDSNDRHPDKIIDPALLNLKLNLSANEKLIPGASDADELYSSGQPSRRISKGEKRLIMLDVDPCCPRHGVGAGRPRSTGQASSSKLSAKSGGRASHGPR